MFKVLVLLLVLILVLRSSRRTPLRGTDADDASLLVSPAEPRFESLVGEDLAAHKVHDLADDDADEGDGVHPVNVEVEDADADDDAPKVGGQQADVEERRARQAEHDRHRAVEGEQAQRVPDEVTGHCVRGRRGAVPVRDRGAQRVAVEYRRLRPVDDQPVETQLAQRLVHRPHAHHEFLADVGEAVERRAQ